MRRLARRLDVRGWEWLLLAAILPLLACGLAGCCALYLLVFLSVAKWLP